MKSRYVMYGNDKDCGIWELSPDMSTQTCISYLVDGELSPYIDDDRVKSTDLMLDPDWSGADEDPSEVNIITEDEVFLLML